MRTIRTLAIALTAAIALFACGGSGTSDEPASTVARVGGSVGVADAINTTRQVAGEAEQRANSVDQIAP